MWMRRRTLWVIVRVIVSAVGLAVVLPFAFFAVYVATTGGTGSAREATRLRAIIEPIPDPESGSGCDPEYVFERFENGEWVLGIGRDSHALLSKYRGGGTVVVKDSRGQIRGFFGHICGSGGLKTYMYRVRSLDEFYQGFTERDILTERQWP